MKFRGCTVPQHKLRLRLPFLVHPTFHTEITQWLRHQVLSYKHWLIPLHLPSHAVEEGAHLSVAELLFNFQHWETRMNKLDPMTLPCSCGQFAALHPQINMVDGHIASSASLLDLPLRLQSLVSYSTNSTVYVGYDKYIQQFRTKIDRWFKNQGFPLQIIQRFWDEFFPRQGYKRNEALAVQSWRLTGAQVLEFKRMVDTKFVLHMADHQSTHLMIFCPQFYFQSVLGVWTQETNFVSVPMSQHQCRLHLYNTIAGSIRSRYCWGIQASARLPRGFVFLKKRRITRKVAVLLLTIALSQKSSSVVQRRQESKCYTCAFRIILAPLRFRKYSTRFKTFSAQSPWTKTFASLMTI